MPFWNKKTSNPVIPEQKPIEPKKEVQMAATIEDLQAEEEHKAEPEIETFVDDETLKESGFQPEVLEEKFENMKNDVEEDPEILALQKQMEELKESKRKAAEEAKKKEEEKAKQTEALEFVENPIFQQPQQIAFVNEFELLRLIYEKLTSIENRILMLERNGK